MPFAPLPTMPLALLDLQAAFAAHIVGPDRAELLGAVTGDSIPAAARLRIHRHHVLHSLATALAANFPTVRALVGEDFFRQMARAFVTQTLPAQPVLSEYGAEFGDFVADYAPARGLPYLADAARLDWALNVAFHSPLEPRLGVAELAAVPAEQLPGKSVSLAAGTFVLRSVYPVDRIWSAAQPNASKETVDLATGGTIVLVMRRTDDAGFVVLDVGEAAFLEALAAGRTLEDSAGAALAASASFDLSSAFSRFLHLGVFAAVQ